MKITIDGRVHVNGALLQYLHDASLPGVIPGHSPCVPGLSNEAKGAIEELIAQDEMSSEDGALGTAEIVGHPDEDLPSGMVLISCGPISLECCAEDLRRAMSVFVDGRRGQ